MLLAHQAEYASAAAGTARQMMVGCKKLAVTNGDRVQETELVVEAPCVRVYMRARCLRSPSQLSWVS